MLRYTLSTFLAVVSLGATVARAEPLTLDDAFALAAQNNPQLRSAHFNADATSGAIMQAAARPNPSLSLLQEGFSGADRTSTALINQTIELGGKRNARLDVASYRREAALASLDSRAAALQADVASAFYGLLAAQRQLQVANESAQLAARSAGIADRRARAGKVSPVEATKARVAASAADIETANARRRVATALDALANATGSEAARTRTATGDLDTLASVEPLTELLPRIDGGPDSRAARAEALRANAAITVEKAKRIPDITISAGMKRISTAGAAINQAVIGISIPLPVFDTNKGALLEAVHQAEKADADVDAAHARLQLELTQAYAAYETAAGEARRLKADVLPAAREALDAVSRGYELGKFAFLDVLDAQRTLFQGESQYVQALDDAHRAYAEIGRLVGAPASPTRRDAITSMGY
ncbi:TolC family protein [Paraburkholderia sp. SOS3]|uniref:TolC family protein n=1 Tax=Paraburkholderia sp. SOS3 TaxID=1926494 RepID=UPI0009F96562|nr:TolC family protein [Paraburkholderia sp. SOS3]